MAWLSEIVYWFVAACFFLLSGACVVSIILSLPGVWVILAMALVIEVLDRFWAAEPGYDTFGWWLLIACVVLAVIGEIIEFFAGVLGAKGAGASTRGMVGALIGGILGIFIFTPFIPIPLVGSLVGVLLGTFAGAVVGELSAQNATVRGTIRPATGATFGRILGTVGKMGVGIAVWLVLSVAAFWP
jgi:uncharacterized protein YqgC (DUF456 family)